MFAKFMGFVILMHVCGGRIDVSFDAGAELRDGRDGNGDSTLLVKRSKKYTKFLQGMEEYKACMAEEEATVDVCLDVANDAYEVSRNPWRVMVLCGFVFFWIFVFLCLNR